jgi:3-oxosteroid 1-dehydrogenase
LPDCDTIVVGAGRAGTAAAAEAEKAGRSVIVLEKTAGARARRLIVEGGRVTGVTLADGRSFTARVAVILATGGYESDPVLTRRFEDVSGLCSSYAATATGDGLRMGGSVGARVHLVRNNLNLKLGYHRASGAFETAVEETARAHSVVVNRFGRRFGNEADYRELAPPLRLFDAVTRTFTNVPCWLVYDRQYAARWGNDAAARPPANTPIDAAGLAATLERFNAYVRDGRDADFGRRAATLGAVAEEPFAAIALHPSVKSSAGLAADNEGRVLNWRGQAIPGLFAAGRLAARVDERPE